MKILLTLSLAALLGVISGYAQTTPQAKTQPACSCGPLKNTPCPVDTISLCYDTCAKNIIQLSAPGLVKGKNYVFRICNVNDVLYAIKATASNITRVAALPTILGSLNGNLSTARTDNTHALFLSMVKKPSSQAVHDYYFVQRFKFDYDVLQQISAGTKTLIGVLNKVPTDTLTLHKAAIATLDGINDSVASLSDAIIKGAEAYMDDPKKDQDTTDANSFKRFIRVNVFDQAKLKAYVAKLLADLDIRASLLFSSTPPISADALNIEQRIEIKRADTVVKSNAAFLAKCPDIIFSILKSKCCIVSSPYQISSDYLQLAVALIKTKFTDKPDTVSNTKLNFYRVKYWKPIDVSAGFFYDNLASAAYYFKNTVPAEEIKSKADISIGALIHSYWVFDSSLKAGPCAGIATSVLDAKSKYLIGGSLIIGKNNEFAFSVGYALASLPKISNLYSTNTLTTTTTTTATSSGSSTSNTTGTTPSSSTTTGTTTTVTTTTAPIGTTGTVNTFNKFQGGIFIGITYSFLKL